MISRFIPRFPRSWISRGLQTLQTLAGFVARILSVAAAWDWAMIWFRSSFLPSQNYLIILAIVIGVLTGFGSVGFIHILHFVADFASNDVASALGVFGPASLVLLPAIGGLFVGPLINRFAPEAKGHGVP